MSEFYKGKNVLVAGGSGTIGSALSKELVKMGANVTVGSIDSKERIRSVFGKCDINFIKTDLTDANACKRLVMPRSLDYDYVFNLVCVKGSSQRQNASVATTFIPLLLADTHLMEASRLAGVKRYMFTGSICEYPNMPLRKEDDVWLGPPEANDRFAGVAKRVGEMQGEAYMLQYGWDATRIVRLSNVYGPYDDFDPKTAHVIPSLISRMVNSENPVNVAGDGSAERDFIYLDDVVRGILIAMEKAPPCTPINIGSGYGESIKNVAEIISSNVDPSPEIVWDTSKPTGDSVRVLDTNRAESLIDFKTKVSIQEGIRKTIEWYKKNKEMADRRGIELHGE